MHIQSPLRMNGNTSEAGFVLVLAMVMLLLVSSYGIWAINTSNSEQEVASGNQRIEEQFNIIEGGAYAEAVKVGFFLQEFYQISNPSLPNQLLIPTTDNNNGPGNFDPGGDTATALAAIQNYKNNPALGPAPVDFWPWENLLRNYTDNTTDYRYLSTYLYADTAPMGYDANQFAGYKFRISSAAAQRPLTVEVGGTKVGPK